MKVRVKMFAAAREALESDQVEIELPEDARVRDLRRALAAEIPRLASLLPHTMIAIDSEYAGDDQPLTPGAEIACIPPVSGG